MEQMDMYADTVIVGTGVSGLFSALNLPRDRKIIMITKSDVESSDSFLAQGGICVLRDEADYESYFEDTMHAGHYENRKESVDIMIRSSREIIQDLIGYGVKFEHRGGSSEEMRKTGENSDFLDGYAFTREGAHSRPRILFHEDVTGKEITSKLLAQVKKLENVKILEYTTMTDIVEGESGCAGIQVKDKAGKEFFIYADDTILQAAGSEDSISTPPIFLILQGMRWKWRKSTVSVWNIWIMYRFIRRRCTQRSRGGDS